MIISKKGLKINQKPLIASGKREACCKRSAMGFPLPAYRLPLS